MDSIQHHLIMYPLLLDLECTLILNETSEDFLTSDHPVALCNSLPSNHTNGALLGFASRGLIILYPISPRALLVFSDSEVYKIGGQLGCLRVRKKQDIVELNLMQFGNAYENAYFSDAGRVQQTLDSFRRRASLLRPPRPSLLETEMAPSHERRRVLLMMEPVTRRLSLPRGMELRRAARVGKYQVGDGFVRNPVLVAGVSEETKRIHALRDAATAKAEQDTIDGTDET